MSAAARCWLLLQEGCQHSGRRGSHATCPVHTGRMPCVPCTHRSQASQSFVGCSGCAIGSAFRQGIELGVDSSTMQLQMHVCHDTWLATPACAGGQGCCCSTSDAVSCCAAVLRCSSLNGSSHAGAVLGPSLVSVSWQQPACLLSCGAAAVVPVVRPRALQLSTRRHGHLYSLGLLVVRLQSCCNLCDHQAWDSTACMC